MNLKSLILSIVLVVALAGVIGGLWYWKKHEPAPTPMQMPPAFVNIEEAKKQTWYPTAHLVGTVLAKQSITVSNEMAGVVTQVNFESGDEVKAGQVLIKQDTQMEESDLAAAEASQRLSAAAIESSKADIAAAQASLNLAQSNQKRYKEAAGSISASEVDRINAEFEKAQADFQRGQASLAKAQAEKDQAAAKVQQINTMIAKKTLTAPFHGLASMRTVHPGQYLAEGTSIVGLMEIADDIYLDFAVPQEYAARVVPGAVVIASSDVLNMKDLQLHVLSMDAMINPTTRNVRVRSSVADPEHKLRQGMSIDVEVPIEAPKEFVVVPRTAIRRAAFGDHVWVLNAAPPHEGMPPSYTAHQQMVKLGTDLGDKVIVLEGVKAGDKIAADGSFKVMMEGAMVIQAPPPQPSGAGSGPNGGGGGAAPPPSKESESKPATK